MKKSFILLAFLSFQLFITAQKHWESIVLASDTWSYLPATSEPPATWYQSTYDVSSWATGSGGFGFADNDDATVVTNANSVYIRKNFVVQYPSLIDMLLLDIDYDDAFVCYLNGVEVARSTNITANPPRYNSTLTTDHEANLYRSLLPERFTLKVSSLKQGINTIAVQILNNGLSSSDMSGLVFLNARVNSSSTLFKPVPGWFTEPTGFESSNLPLIYINTEGKTIADEPKITAGMKVINNPNGVNNLNDTVFEYNDRITIEIRGSSSQMFEKKSFRIETQTVTGENNNVSLLGMPKENDWVLYAPYTDKSLMRNAVAYHFGNLMGRWSPKVRYCELFINGEYRGIYLLTEVIKKDKNRVNLSDLKTTDISGDQLTGGYILKIDRPDPGYWVSPYKSRNNMKDVPVSYVDPKYDELTVEQREYIKNHVTAFETALWQSTFKDPVKGYRPYIDIISFVDYYIINELSRNLDANRVSTFFYKDRDSKDGTIKMGPFWDYNLGFGNANFFNAGSTTGWVVDGVGNGDTYGITFWWDKFRQDSYFEYHLRKRWADLRSDQFSNEKFTQFIDSIAVKLNDAQKRNFEKFKILGTYVWPNNYVGGTYANEVTYLKTWINSRFTWMDGQIALISAVEPVSINPTMINIQAYPNPFSDKISFYYNLDEQKQVQLIISDLLGKEIINQTSTGYPGTNEINIEFGESDNLIGNIYFYRLISGGKMAGSGKLIRKN